MRSGWRSALATTGRALGMELLCCWCLPIAFIKHTHTHTHTRGVSPKNVARVRRRRRRRRGERERERESLSRLFVYNTFFFFHNNHHRRPEIHTGTRKQMTKQSPDENKAWPKLRRHETARQARSIRPEIAQYVDTIEH